MAIKCCGPSPCCSCKAEPQSVDSCMCGCAYLNGGGPIFLGQFFSLMAGLLSVGTIIDCSFATIDETTLDLGDGLTIKAGGVGFIFVQKTDGHCYWYNYAADPFEESKLQNYWNLLGKPWEFASILTWTCACFSWFFFLYSISFCCSSQIKQIRHLFGFVMAGLMTICQACTFIVYAEEFCQAANCTFSRGSGLSLAAMACYVIAGLGFFFSKDYPGEEALEKKENDEKSRSESLEDGYDYEEEKGDDRYDDEINPNFVDPYGKGAMQ